MLEFIMRKSHEKKNCSTSTNYCLNNFVPRMLSFSFVNNGWSPGTRSGECGGCSTS